MSRRAPRSEARSCRAPVERRSPHPRSSPARGRSERDRSRRPDGKFSRKYRPRTAPTRTLDDDTSEGMGRRNLPPRPDTTRVMRTEPPFRADHVGSLLRPKELLKAREDHAAGRIDDELRGLEDEAIREVIARQEEIGLQSATDGEFRAGPRAHGLHLSTGQHQQVQQPSRSLPQQGQGVRLGAHPPASTRSYWLPETIFGSDFESCAEQVSSARPKLTIPSPSMVHYRGGRSAINESYCRYRRVLVRPDRGLRRAGPAPGQARLHLPTARRHLAGLHQRPGAAQARRGDRRRPRAPARDLHRQHQPRLAGRRRECRDRPHVPRQQPVDVGGGGRLRVRRRGAVQPTRGRRVLLRVGRRAVRRLRAAALISESRGFGIGDLQAPDLESRTIWCVGSRPRSSSTSTSSVSRRSAASDPPRRATTSATSSSPSCGAWSRLPSASGVECPVPDAGPLA